MIMPLTPGVGVGARESWSLIRRSQAMNAIKTAGLALLSCLIAASPLAFAQPKQKPSEVYMYKGADRDQRLAERARQEGTVVIYTSLNLVDSVPLTEVFEKKYGFKVNLWRASSEKVVQRAVTEA